MFSSMDTGELLEAAIGDAPPVLPSSSQAVPLQLSSKSSDALPSSSVVSFNITDHDPPHDPPTEDEQPRQEKGTAHEHRGRQSHDFLEKTEGKVRRRTRRRKMANPLLPILLMSLLARL